MLFENETGGLALIPVKNPQEGWTEMFNAVADFKNDELLLDVANDFDDEEWTW